MTLPGRESRCQRASLVFASILFCSGGGARTGLEVGDLAEPPLPDGGGRAPCPTGFADCDDEGRCATDLGASSEHCGACGNVCPEGLVCGAGVCRSPGDIVRVTAGDDYTCALRASGEVLCWGSNQYGQLGDGTLELHWTPMPVLGLADAVQIHGSHLGFTPGAAMCARRASGTLACWGEGGWGQLGNGLDEQPVKCGPGLRCNPLPSEVVGVVEAASVAMTSDHVCALLRDGSVWCWGFNGWGQLGDGTTETRSTAAPVVDLGPALQIAARSVDCATLPTGQVACWGLDGYGWTGAPGEEVLTPAIAKNVSDAVSVWVSGPDCIIRAGGALSCTGSNAHGQLDPDLPDDVTGGEMIRVWLPRNARICGEGRSGRSPRPRRSRSPVRAGGSSGAGAVDGSPP